MRDNISIKNLVIEHIGEMKSKSLPFCRLLKNLSEASELVLFGGAVRDIIEGATPRDYDFVVSCQPKVLKGMLDGFSYTQNSFGGYKVELDDYVLDIWALADTWAFRTSHLAPGVANLKNSVFLNIDSLLVEIKGGKVFSEGYKEALSKNTLDIVLEKNPLPSLCVLRTFVFQSNKDMRISDGLKNYIKCWASGVENPINEISKVQLKHYGKEIFSEDSLRSLLSQVA